MRTYRISRKALYLGMVVAMIASTLGFVSATVLTATPALQSANFYQGGDNGVTGYSTPTLQVTTTPSGISACSTGTVTDSTSGGTAVAYLSSSSGSSACKAGNFAEEFTLGFSATIASQTNTLTVTSEVGSGTVATNSVTVTLGTATSGPFTATVEVYVDYGAVNPPTGGITILDLVVQ